MTNFEKWHDQITELGDSMAVVRGVPRRCSSTSCSQCEFDSRCCATDAWHWLYKEYNEDDLKPKRKIDVDDFALYLKTEINKLEVLEQSDADNGDYARAIEHHGYTCAFYELLGLITLDTPPDWVKIEEEE